MLPIRSLQTAGVALSLLAGLALAASVAARPGGGWDHGPGPHGRFLERQIDDLALPAETRSAVQAVLDESKASQQALREQIHAAHQSMRALLEQDAVDEAAVMAQADALGALMTQSRKQELGTLIRVRSLLTPAERAALDRQMQERREQRREHGGRGKGECAHGERGEVPSESAS